MDMTNITSVARRIAVAPAVALALACFVPAFPAPSAAAQTSTSQSSATRITGEVYDAEGEPVIGASVKPNDSKISPVTTDIDGRFVINADRPVKLTIYYVGCKTVTVTATPGVPLTINLENDATLLDDVVVVGFAVQKKVNLTGAVGTASAKDIADRPVSNTVTALQGLIPGLNISNSTSGGELNAQKQINIRGTATIGEGSSGSPLILIDGMEGDLNAINPQDIESISVLKDAASSSIYGSRAPFGVILVTTKSGSQGKTTVRYNNSFRFNQPLTLPHMMDSWQFVNYLNDVTANTSPGTAEFDPDYVEKVRQYWAGESDVVADGYHWQDGHSIWGTGESMGVYANVNWIDEYYKSTAFAQEHNLSLTGGTDKINYYVSGNFMDQGGFMNHGNDSYNRYSIMGKINAQLYSWLNIGLTSRWSRYDYSRSTTMDGGFYDNIMRRAVPINPIYDPNGFLASDFNYIESLDNGGRHNEQNDIFTNQFKVTITPLKNWNIIGEFNARINNDWTHEDGNPIYAHDAVDPNQTHIPTYTSRTTSYVYEYSRRTTYLNANVYSNYMFTLADKHNFTALAGMQVEDYRYRDINASRNDEVSTDLPVLNLTTSRENYSLGGQVQNWRTAGFFGRINYDYDNKYLLEVNLRYDGTSRFRRDHRWVFSPSVSVGWNIDREKFWEKIQPYVQGLKVRASYGQLANQNTDTWYPTYRIMGTSNGNGGWLVNGEMTNKAWFPSLISSTLTWEKIRNTNIGIDVSALRNRLTASFDYFWRNNRDMVGSGSLISLPATLGATPPNQNSLAMRTYGWELSLGWRDNIGDFVYNVKFNLSDDQTKITDYPNREQYLDRYIAGMVTGQIWGLTTVGIARDQAQMDAHLANVNQDELDSSPWMAGDVMYADLDGDGKIHKQQTLTESGDLKVIGNTTPRFRIGFNLYMQWKGIDVSAFFQGVGKRDYYFSPYGGQGAGEKGAAFWGATVGGRWESLFFTEHLDYWRDDSSLLGENYDAYYARPIYYTNKNRECQTRYLQNAAYLRLKNLQIGYTLPRSLTQKIYISNLRIFFSGENLCTWTNMSKVIDPESLEVSKMKSGATYPLARTYSFGLSVDF